VYEQDEDPSEKVQVGIDKKVIVPLPGATIDTENIYNKRLTGDVGSAAINSRTHLLLKSLG